MIRRAPSRVLDRVHSLPTAAGTIVNVRELFSVYPQKFFAIPRIAERSLKPFRLIWSHLQSALASKKTFTPCHSVEGGACEDAPRQNELRSERARAAEWRIPAKS